MHLQRRGVLLLLSVLRRRRHCLDALVPLLSPPPPRLLPAPPVNADAATHRREQEDLRRGAQTVTRDIPYGKGYM